MTAPDRHNQSRHDRATQNPDGRNRKDIEPGARVRVVEKRNQRSGETTEGIVQDILTKSPSHPHGIKVRLESGEVGRVKEVLAS